MSSKGKPERDHRSRVSRHAQATLFTVVAREQPEVLSDLRGEPLKRFTALPDSLKARASWTEVKALADYAAGMPIRAERVKAKWGAEAEDLASFMEAVTVWVSRWQLGKLTGWLLDFVAVQLGAWSERPDEAAGNSWVRLEHRKLSYEDPPRKFVYTLRVSEEDFWLDEWEARQPRVQTVQGSPITVPNPYEVESSESGGSLRGLDGLEKMRAEYIDGLGAVPDWNPETGESYEDAVKRIGRDFKVRLRKHLKAKKEEFERAGLGIVDKPELERDALWTYQRHVLGWTFSEISFAAGDGSDDGDVEQQVRAFVKLIG